MYKSKDGYIQDIFDGDYYHKFAKFTKQKGYFTFQLNCDGANPYKSSKMNYWPIYLVCNELPKSVRYKRQNMLFVGLWTGVGKPNFNIYYQPLQQSMEKWKSGVHMINPDGNQELVRGFLHQSVYDKPAQVCSK
jgi:hypothetical protein